MSFFVNVEFFQKKKKNAWFGGKIELKLVTYFFNSGKLKIENLIFWVETELDFDYLATLQDRMHSRILPQVSMQLLIVNFNYLIASDINFDGLIT